MSGNAISFTVQYNKFPQIAEQIQPMVALRLDQGMAAILQDAQSRCPTKTGGLRASGFRITPVTNTYAQAVGAMQARNPKAIAEQPPASTKGSAHLGFAANYAAAVHNGHHTRSGTFVAARPFLSNAFVDNKKKLLELVAQGIRDACKV